jgi:hypothetical protein
MAFPALTTLKLHQIKNRPPLVEFLELLRGLATLQVLDVQDSLPFARDHDRTIGPIDPIHLPSLHYLCLSSTKHQKQVSDVLSCITAPQTTTLRFVVRIGSAENMPSSFSAFVSHMNESLSYSTLHVLSVARSRSCSDFP